MKIHLTYFIALLLFSLLAGCSTEKDKRLNRFYHNTTAYYNGYFNAREIIKVSHKDYSKNVPEDFTLLIPVNRYPNEEESKSFFPEMNRAIDKTSTVIGKHAMPNVKKGRVAKEEYGKWMDENWLVMGISYFYKREYDEAIEKFKYIVKMYPKDKSKYYAKIWLAKTYIELGDFPEALKYINEIEVEKQAKKIKETKQKKTKERRKKYKKRRRKKMNRRSSIKRTKKREEVKEERSFLVEFPEKMNADYFATQADFYLRRNDFTQSIELLDSAIHYEKSKKLRVRYHFIQAQLNQELGNLPQASVKYSYVIKKSSSYQLVFYSKINRALVASSKDRGALKEELLDLAKDEKYIEFRDQIYYALADIELQEYNKSQGIVYLEISAASAPSNEKQKAKTFKRLADVYFEDKEYVFAQKYYDSTLLELDPKNAVFEEIKERNESLTRLVTYIKTIAFKDSMLALGSLDEKQRRDRIEEILYQEKAKKIEEERVKNLNLGGNDPAPVLATTALGEKGSFWIYNDKTKASGLKSFKSVWGTISLEDNWRRSNKSQSNVEDIVNVNNSPVVSDKEIEEFLKQVPVEESEVKSANVSILNANYLSGLIYTNILGNEREAIQSFKDNKKRFHPNPKITPSLYQLYVIYQNLNQRDDEVAVKNFILENYPKSKEAKIILDPDYISKQQEGKDVYQRSYEEVYNLVEIKSYLPSLAKIDALLSQKETNPYECQLLYLKAKVLSDLDKKEELDTTLQRLVDNCANTPLGDIAEKALGKLRNERISKEDNQEVVFVKDEKSAHYFCVIVPITEDLNKLKIALSNFNSSSFDEKGLKISSVGLDAQYQTILVKQFGNKSDANSYMVAYKVNPTMKPFVSKYPYFTITPLNYSLLFKSKSVKKYEEFFNLNYY